MRRLKEFVARADAVEEALEEPSATEIAVLRSVFIDPDKFAPTDIIVAANAVVIARALRDVELPTLVEFAVSMEGLTCARAFSLILMLREHWPGAARVIIADAAYIPRENRSYVVWKWFSVMFGMNPNREHLSRHLQLALLDTFAGGGDAEREVIGDILGHGNMSMTDVESLRKSLK